MAGVGDGVAVAVGVLVDVIRGVFVGVLVDVIMGIDDVSSTITLSVDVPYFNVTTCGESSDIPCVRGRYVTVKGGTGSEKTIPSGSVTADSG